MRSLVAAVAGLLSAVYLLNPTMGFFELIPDNLPLVGNLDEAGAALLLLASLRHFGIDLTAALLSGRRRGPTDRVTRSNDRADGDRRH